MNISKEEFGIAKTEKESLVKDLNVTKQEREVLITQFEELSKIEVTEENTQEFKALRLKIVKNRTKGIEKWHTVNKAYYLNVGRFLDSIKNKEIFVNKQMEEKLLSAEQFFERKEAEKLAKIEAEKAALQEERRNAILEFTDEERDYSAFNDDEFLVVLETAKAKHKKRLAQIEAEKKEKEEKEKAERERIARIEAENERLKKKKMSLIKLLKYKRVKGLENSKLKKLRKKLKEKL